MMIARKMMMRILIEKIQHPPRRLREKNAYIRVHA